MELYIRITDGQPFEHPIFADNFKQAFPDIDTENLPSEFAKFERVEQPSPGVYQVYEGCVYTWVDGIVKDVHTIREMTAKEKKAKQTSAKADWAQNGHASWIFDATTCTFTPPVAYPDDENLYSWNEEQQTWELVDVQATIS